MSDLKRISEIHYHYLSTKFSSALGEEGLFKLYKKLNSSPEVKILSFKSSLGISAFCSFTNDYKKTAREMANSLSFYELFKATLNIPTLCDIFYKKIWAFLYKNNYDIYILAFVKVETNFSANNMIDEIEKYALQANTKKIWVDTRTINNRAVAFYLKCGFKIISRSPFSYLLMKEITVA
ncbi:GNAT family N-acetyltransferase [Candidatus Methylopumilus planktonicus]|uniref:GNAT family N-acetyltransferase n=1 Tax=Candidatus Methylopumilus planktonicus TaxID=1581557 RepID=UPI003BEF4AA6